MPATGRPGRACLGLLCLMIFAGGCLRGRVTPRPLGQVIHDYRAIRQGMPEFEVIDRLGRPDNVDRNGRLHWEEGHTGGDWADLYISPREIG